MKLFLLPSIILVSLSSFAQIVVQRTTSSSLADYEAYLKKENLLSFSQAYIQISAVTELNTPLLEQCLEEVYLGAPFEDTCFESVKSLTSRPLNSSRREVLTSFLKKLTKVSRKNKSFFSSFAEGLEKTHPKGEDKNLPDEDDRRSLVSDLEMNAWKKALKKTFDIKEVSLLINGKKVMNLENWKAPEGVFQWSFITNTHEPITRLSSFSLFAAESLRALKALNDNDCKKIEESEPKKYGILKLEVFSSKKCVVQFHKLYTPDLADGHLAPSSKVVNLESGSKRQWGWAATVILGAAAAMALKDKNVELSWSGSFH